MAQFRIYRRDAVRSVDGLVKDIVKVREARDQQKLWFRGHSCASFKLLPTIARTVEYAGFKRTFGRDEESLLLHRFRRRAYPQDRDVRYAGYALFLARHHGLPTRLLDWTANPLFALYFSCVEHLASDATLWAFRQRDYRVWDAFRIAEHRSEESLFESDNRGPQVRIVHPVFNSTRLVAQEGGFTWHAYPWRPLEQLSRTNFENGLLDVDDLHAWRIPKGRKPALLRELSGLGINHRSVFPDLDGIARSLWETEVLWNH